MLIVWRCQKLVFILQCVKFNILQIFIFMAKSNISYSVGYYDEDNNYHCVVDCLSSFEIALSFCNKNQVNFDYNLLINWTMLDDSKKIVKPSDGFELVDTVSLSDDELKAMDVENFDDFKISFGCPRFENVPDEKQRCVMQALFVLRCALDNMERLLKYDGEITCYQAWCVQIVANVLFDTYGFLKP